MLPLALTLLAASAILLALALRGRTIARGRFCRHCRFDLAGLDQPTTCPECGRDLSAPKATRPTLRRTRRPLLAVAAVLLLAGVSLTAIAATNITARLLAALPDRAIHALHNLGVDAALTEITTNRLTRTPPLPTPIWADLIADAAAHQADTATPFDIRHGEVLGQAWVSGRLTDEQLAAYFELASVIDAGFAESIPYGATTLPAELVHQTGDRFTATNVTGPGIGGVQSMFLEVRQLAIGVDGTDMTPDPAARGATYISEPSPYGGSRLSAGFQIPLDAFDWSAVQPGGDLMFSTTVEMIVTRASDHTEILRTTRTIERPVRVLPTQAETARLVMNPETIAAWAHADLRIIRLHTPPPGTGEPLAAAGMVISNTPAAIAGRVVIRFNGRDTEIGPFSAPAHRAQSILLTGFQWTGPTTPEDAALAAEWLAAGTVDVLILPDPAVAERTKDIRDSFGLPLLFEGVRVVGTPRPSSSNSLPHPGEVRGRPIPAASPIPSQTSSEPPGP